MEAKAKELNARIEGEASKCMDDLDRRVVRPIAHQSYKCVVQCFDKAGTKESQELLHNCSTNCQVPYQQSNSILQNEFGQFQNRLNRSMGDCQDKARDLMSPGQENNASATAKVEQALITCMAQKVDEYIKLLPSTKQRIVATIQNLK